MLRGVFKRLTISSKNLRPPDTPEPPGPARLGLHGGDFGGRAVQGTAGQPKFTSLHRKYVWSMCEACQTV
ncbi:hypothetical protein SHIRM173S_09207 [Streptomyces hirsutus]